MMATPSQREASLQRLRRDQQPVLLHLGQRAQRYGLYQIGEVYARSWVIIGTLSGILIPYRMAS